MNYYVAKGPIRKYCYDWLYSYYEVSPTLEARVFRIFHSGRTEQSTIRCISLGYIRKYCKKITKEEYESIFEL